MLSLAFLARAYSYVFKLQIGRFINIHNDISNHAWFILDFSAIVADYLKEAIDRTKLQYYCEINI